MKTSKVFAAFRQSISMEITQAIADGIVPEFNAECADIRRKFDDTITFATTEAASDNARNKLIDLAHATRKARILDLAKRRNEAIDKHRIHFLGDVRERLTDYNAEMVEDIEGGKKVLRAKFPDGSMAKVPQNLFVNYDQFDRV